MGSKKMPSKSKPALVSPNRTQTLADCIKQLHEVAVWMQLVACGVSFPIEGNEHSF